MVGAQTGKARTKPANVCLDGQGPLVQIGRTWSGYALTTLDVGVRFEGLAWAGHVYAGQDTPDGVVRLVGLMHSEESAWQKRDLFAAALVTGGALMGMVKIRAASVWAGGWVRPARIKRSAHRCVWTGLAAEGLFAGVAWRVYASVWRATPGLSARFVRREWGQIVVLLAPQVPARGMDGAWKMKMGRTCASAWRGGGAQLAQSGRKECATTRRAVAGRAAELASSLSAYVRQVLLGRGARCAWEVIQGLAAKPRAR